MLTYTLPGSTFNMLADFMGKGKDELKNELVTRDVFEERFKVIDERFKRLDFKLNIFIGIALIGITFANPSFVELIKHVLR
jgi:hypothetical protein